jgi:hypothetical protein
VIASRFTTNVKDLVVEMWRNIARGRGRRVVASCGWVRRRSGRHEAGVFEAMRLR